MARKTHGFFSCVLKASQDRSVQLLFKIVLVQVLGVALTNSRSSSILKKRKFKRQKFVEVLLSVVPFWLFIKQSKNVNNFSETLYFNSDSFAILWTKKKVSFCFHLFYNLDQWTIFNCFLGKKIRKVLISWFLPSFI